MSSNEDNRDLQSRHSPSQAKNNSANGSSGDKQNGSSPGKYLRPGSPMEAPSVSPAKSDEDTSSFEHISVSEAVQHSTLHEVMKTLRRRHYDVSEEDHLVEDKSRRLFERDYRCEIISNIWCPNYPVHLLIPVAVLENECEKEGSLMDFNKEAYIKLVAAGTHSRVRSRYPVPVILFDNKFICRSGTLANAKSAAYNQATGISSPATTVESVSTLEAAIETIYRVTTNVATALATILGVNDLKELFNKDKESLELLKVEHVCDFMVEYAKLFKDFLDVSSCEVLHKDVYRSIHIQDLPFPGCEFFKIYSEADRNPEGLKFDFSQNEVKRSLVITDKDLKKLIPDLKDKKEDKLLECDVTEITKNYLKIMLAFLVKDKGGVLVHCISGWDRTPLFISLLRLSLWADGVIHKSLDYEDMTYLTVAYDWYMFGHDFPTRFGKREEIMHFSFNFLSYMTSDEFSVTKMFRRLTAEERGNRQFPDYEPGRRTILNDVRQCFMDSYEKHILNDDIITSPLN